jgi:hypothetical protein
MDDIFASRSVTASSNPGVSEITVASLALCGRVIYLEEDSGESSSSNLFDCGQGEDISVGNMETGQQTEVGCGNSEMHHRIGPGEKQWNRQRWSYHSHRRTEWYV